MRILTGAMIALIASCAAFAQPGPHGPTAGQGGQPGDNMPMMGMMMGHCAMMQRTEGALAFLRTELKITPAQEKAWDAFAADYRAEATNRPKGPRADGSRAMMGRGMMGGASGPFPQTMAQRIQMMENHLAGAKKLTDAAKPLYDGLSAEQRKTADELLPHFIMMRCPMM